MPLCKSLKAWAVRFLGCALTMRLVLLFLACADHWHTGMLSALSCPVPVSMDPTVAGCKGLTTGGPYVQPASGGGRGVTPVQLFKLQQLRCLASPVNVSART